MISISVRLVGAVILNALIAFVPATRTLQGQEGSNRPVRANALVGTSTETSSKTTNGLTVKLASSKIVLGEPVELVFRVDEGGAKKPSVLPDFLGGQALVRVIVKDDATKQLSSTRLSQDQLDFDGPFLPQRFTRQLHSRQRATYIENGKGSIEVHVWLLREQVSIFKDGTYQVSVALGKVRSSKSFEADAVNNAKTVGTNSKVPTPQDRKTQTPDSKRGEEFALVRGVDAVELPLLVETDDVALLKKAEGLRYKISGASSEFTGLQNDETVANTIIELFSLTGPVAQRVQERLVDDIAQQPSRSKAIFYGTLTRAATPEIVDFLAEQAWNKNSAGAKQTLTNISVRASPEMRSHIVDLFVKHDEKMPSFIMD